MTSSKATVSLTGERFAIELDRGDAPHLRAGGDWQLAASFPDALVLLRESAPRAFFAGSLASLGMGEVFGFVLSGIRTGRLHVTRGNARRWVSFKDGQVTFASSTEAHERLGASLVRRGRIDGHTLARALEKVGPHVRLGQVLTRMGALKASELYGEIAILVQEIVLALFELDDGEFLFVEGSLPKEDAVKLPIHTRDLALEGLKRAEELSRLRQRLTPALTLEPGPAAPSGELDEAAVRAVAARANLSALREVKPGPERDFLRWVDSLLVRGVLAEAPGENPAASGVEGKSALELYGELIRTICLALKAAGKDLSELSAYFESPPPGLEEAFAGVSLSEDGALDVARVIANVSGAGAALGRALAYEALDAFASFALFSAKNALPPDLAERLAETLRIVSEGR